MVNVEDIISRVEDIAPQPDTWDGTRPAEDIVSAIVWIPPMKAQLNYRELQAKQTGTP